MIWTKEDRDRIDILLIPEEILKDFIEVHIQRKFKKGETKTCIVTKENDWNGTPSENQVIDLLKQSLNRFRIIDGFDVKILIRHQLFNNTMCRNYFSDGKTIIPKNDIYSGFFKITFFKINGRYKKTIEELRKRPWLSFTKSQMDELILLFKNVENKYPKEFVFLIEHIHPVEK